jgi:UDP-glucose 4-epimerase
LDAARARGLPRVLACDLAEEAPGCAEFDIAVCLDVIYHRRVASEAALLGHLMQALRSGGLLLLHAPAFEWLRGSHDVAVHTRRRFRRSEIVGLLATAGFRVDYATYRLPLLVLPLLLRRIWSRRRVARGPGAVPLSDLGVPGGLDRWLAAMTIVENRLLCAGLRLPVGTSVFAVARRPPDDRIRPPVLASVPPPPPGEASLSTLSWNCGQRAPEGTLLPPHTPEGDADPQSTPSAEAAPATVTGAFRGRNVLITGGLGFIGSTLARRLLPMGARVTVVDSLIPEYGGNLFNVQGIQDRLRINISDVRDPCAFRHLVEGQHVLFNLAGQTSHLDSMREPGSDLEMNCRAQISILESCRHVNPSIRIVFAGTRQVYGRPDYLPVDEKHPVRPVDVNGINKTAGEWYHLLYSSVYGVRCCVLRLTNTYGPRMRVRDARQTFLGVWLRRLIEGEPIEVFGDGRNLRDFTYVDDVVNALLLAASADRAVGQVYNLGGTEVLSLRDLAGLLIEVNGGGRYEMVPFADEVKRIDIGDYYGDFRRIESDLGWRPAVGLRTGLRRSLAYYRRHRREYWD